jgi:hypothetical protein
MGRASAGERMERVLQLLDTTNQVTRDNRAWKPGACRYRRMSASPASLTCVAVPISVVMCAPDCGADASVVTCTVRVV